jgi:hypothetical protein
MAITASKRTLWLATLQTKDQYTSIKVLIHKNLKALDEDFHAFSASDNAAGSYL